METEASMIVEERTGLLWLVLADIRLASPGAEMSLAVTMSILNARDVLLPSSYILSRRAWRANVETTPFHDFVRRDVRYENHPGDGRIPVVLTVWPPVQSKRGFVRAANDAGPKTVSKGPGR